MKCEICENNFTLIKQRGGNNRKICYNCLPSGLSREDRNKSRSILLRDKARKQKEELGCSICGYNKCCSALEWHHNIEGKEKHPANALKIGWDAYQAEISLCVLLCSNCHREIHFDENK